MRPTLHETFSRFNAPFIARIWIAPNNRGMTPSAPRLTFERLMALALQHQRWKSQTRVAEEIGVSLQRLQNWKAGRPVPSSLYPHIARKLRISVEELLGQAKPIPDDDGLGALSQEEMDVVHAWRSWADETREIVRSLMRNTALRGHPALEVARDADPEAQKRADEALERAQAAERARERAAKKYGGEAVPGIGKAKGRRDAK